MADQVKIITIQFHSYLTPFFNFRTLNERFNLFFYQLYLIRSQFIHYFVFLTTFFAQGDSEPAELVVKFQSNFQLKLV